jgi:hypothetical protein
MDPSRIAEIEEEAHSAFASDTALPPALTLRGGDAIDSGKTPPEFDTARDEITDDYIEAYHWGLPYLDAHSWRHALPYLLRYALRTLEKPSAAVDALLNSLRPPDRTPPRLASLSIEQEIVISRVLDVLCFSPESAYHELACQTTEEWWQPNAMYRPPNDA